MRSSNSDHRIACCFAKLMFACRTKPVLDLLSGMCRGRKLCLNELVDADKPLAVLCIVGSDI